MSLGTASLATVLLALGAQEASVDARPPMWTESLVWIANVQSDPVHPVHFGKLSVSLESTTLEDVRTRVGSGTIFHNGDAGESLAWLCYTFVQGGAAQIVWLSSSEMGGGEVIDGITSIQSKSEKPDTGTCSALPDALVPAQLENGLWLGATETQVLEAFGSPRKNAGGWSYVFEGKHGKYDISSQLAFKFYDGKVVGIALSRVTST